MAVLVQGHKQLIRVRRVARVTSILHMHIPVACAVSCFNLKCTIQLLRIFQEKN